MNTLLTFVNAVDWLNERTGRLVRWGVLLAVLSTTFGTLFGHWIGAYSNTLAEIALYNFGALFLLAAGYTHKHNGHVRVDVLSARYAPRTRAWIDIAGGLLFLLPLCGLMIWLSWPGVVESFVNGERSADAGGLIRWPVRLMIPLGFALLALQGLAETARRVAFLAGRAELPTERAVEEV
jgi:TRAP-type mannitol/chloroaromatic compound transport system permease small subunit